MYFKRLNEGIEIHNRLNPKIWTKENELRPEVKKKLNKITEQFISEIRDNGIPFRVIDIRLVGSNMSYNYTEDSDIDLHIVTTLSNQTSYNTSIMQSLYKYFRSSFNQKYEISIHNINVELYIEDEMSTVSSNGIYSLLYDKWIKFPEKIKYKKIDISKEIKPYLNRYIEIINFQDSDEADKLYAEICLLRKDSIAKDGELGVGNLIFKEFRSKGYLKNLRDVINKGISKDLSVESLQTEGYGYKWKPSKTAKREFAQTMSDIDQFCYDNAITQSKNSDSYYFTIDGQKYRVSNHTIEASNRGAYNDFGERVRPNYHDEKEKEEEIQITAGKTRIKQIYNDLKAGYKLDKRGNRM